MKVDNQFGSTSEYTRSLGSIYVSSSVHDSRVENRSAVFLNVAIVALLLALIGFSGFSTDLPERFLGHHSAQSR